MIPSFYSNDVFENKMYIKYILQSIFSDQFTLNKIWKNSTICVSRWSIYGEKLRVKRDF